MPKEVTVVLPDELMDELLCFGYLAQGSQKVDLESIMQEALGDWLKKRASEHGLEPQ